MGAGAGPMTAARGAPSGSGRWREVLSCGWRTAAGAERLRRRAASGTEAAPGVRGTAPRQNYEPQRARRAGWRSTQYPRAAAWHGASQSLRHAFHTRPCVCSPPSSPPGRCNLPGSSCPPGQGRGWGEIVARRAHLGALAAARAAAAVPQRQCRSGSAAAAAPQYGGLWRGGEEVAAAAPPRGLTFSACCGCRRGGACCPARRASAASRARATVLPVVPALPSSRASQGYAWSHSRRAQPRQHAAPGGSRRG